jgi:UDP-galactopyranose mutase
MGFVGGGAGTPPPTAAWYLHSHADAWDVTVYEASPWVGGQLRGAFMSHVPYEPHGPHIFHTSNEEAWSVVRDYCDLNGYRHKVVTVAGPNEYLLTWPLQVSELKQLPEWGIIWEELQTRPVTPDKSSFETYAVGVFGKTLYEWCVYGYTMKQWGVEPRLLSASFAPKRIALRDDDNDKMFRDRYEGWCEGGWHNLVENLLHGISVQAGEQLFLRNLPPADRYIITAPLDEFLGRSPLAWRGVTTRFGYTDNANGSILPAAVVNTPSLSVPYTRKVETRQMSMAAPARGTVIGFEYPGGVAKHYPVDDVGGENRLYHRSLVRELQRALPEAVLAGRLANYVYIDIDQAIIQGLNAARKVAGRGKA